MSDLQLNGRPPPRCILSERSSKRENERRCQRIVESELKDQIMGAHLARAVPVLIIDVAGGLAGCSIALGWWKKSGRAVDRDSVMFLATLFASIALLGMVFAFIL